ncbi:hypothetical protein Ade02nite_09980 [Paractinoplanes deccanensis]|uniref:Uncharacterized protein n=1 Tax=Paractinoplanes deccanensis TaxID=113561 RepID=A0ABQ3XX80_9ACTN|nr:hypothetical protein [Actinoplanes deccanensis]GID72357.1 hypothetical protein Ade02nite_09980 [Actinoplanes deccanensis]
MQRRVPLGDRKVAGATLTVSTMGGYSIHLDGTDIGYVHAGAADGDQWHTYRRHTGRPDEYLGRFAMEEAVRRLTGAPGPR